MRIANTVRGLVLALGCACSLPAASTDYQSTAIAAAQWLMAQQKVDGSWCDQPMPSVCTSEATAALGSLSYRNSFYTGGVAWLENHSASNTDFVARRLGVLRDHGDTVDMDNNTLVLNQNLNAVGNKGWGLSAFYDGDVVDTALALLALAGSSAGTDAASALAFLKTTQLTGTDKGWSATGDAAIDDATTAIVVRALSRYSGSDPSLNTNIQSAISTLSLRVSAASPGLVRAHTALALLSRDNQSVHGRALVDSLLAGQLGDGSFSQDVYLTALTGQALALLQPGYGASAGTVVTIPDAALRKVINQTLGRNAGDAITVGDMLRLQTLNAAGLGITNVTGLQHALNVSSIDLRFNQIASVANLASMPRFYATMLDGNPLTATADADGDGLSDAAELQAGTLPLNPDTDGDGIQDGADSQPNTPNQPPTISAIANQITSEDTATSAVSFTVGDSVTPAASLIVTGASSNTTLVPNANIVFGGSGANRTVVVTPASNQSGTATITVTVSDGNLSAQQSFTLTVNAVNDAPTISSIAAQTINEDTPTSALAFTIGDVDTAIGSLSVSASSANTTLIPNANVVFGGSGASRTVTITPEENQSGSAAVTITVSDGSLVGTRVVNVTVTAVNDAPVASNRSFAVNEDGVLTGSLSATDIDSGTLTYSKAADPASGAVIFNANGSFTYTPNSNVSGTDNFSYRANDGALDSNVAVVTITIVPLNDAPTISAIANQTTNEDVATPAIGFTVGDLETSVGSLTLSAASSNATLVPVGNIVFGGAGASRTVTITPAANQNGSSTITVTVSDGALTSNRMFILTVNAVNDAPTIGAISAQSTSEDTPTGAITFSVNDLETVAASLTMSGSSSNSTLVPTANIVFGGSGGSRTVTVTPAPNQNGTATITLTVSDGSLTAISAFQLTVSAVNDKPTISSISAQSIAEDVASGAIPFTVADIDTPLAALSVTASSGNTALIPNANIVLGGSGANRTIAVTPAANQSGSGVITVNVSDEAGTTSTTFTVTVTAVNDAPAIAALSNQSTNEDFPTTPVSISLSDIDTAVTMLVLTGSSSNTTLVPNANIVFSGTGASRTVVITPAANQHGSVVITVNVSDGEASASRAFTLTVNAVNDPPTISAINDLSVNEDAQTSPIAFTVSDVDTPIANIVVTAQATSSPQLILSMTLGGSGASRTITIIPANDKTGTATITIFATDPATPGSTGTESFNLTMLPVNDPPNGLGDSISLNEGATSTALVGGATSVLSNDSDVDGNALTVQVVNSPLRTLVFTLNPDGTFVYIHDGSESPTDSFRYRIFDGTTYSAPIYVSISINPVNDAPTASGMAVIGDEDTSINGWLSAYDPDSFSNLNYSKQSNPVNGSATVNADGSFVYVPNANFNGTDSFTYKVSDGSLESNVATVTLTVRPINDRPNAVADNWSVQEDNVLNIPARGVLMNDQDMDGDNLSAVLATGPSSGSVTLSQNGGFVYTPNPNFFGTDSFSYKASDGSLDSIPVFVSVTVAPVNDGPPVLGEDFIDLVKGQETIIHPLDNDMDPDGTLSIIDVTVIGIDSNDVSERLSMNVGSTTIRMTPIYLGRRTFKLFVRSSDGDTAEQFLTTSTYGEHKFHVLAPPEFSGPSSFINQCTPGSDANEMAVMAAASPRGTGSGVTSTGQLCAYTYVGDTITTSSSSLEFSPTAFDTPIHDSLKATSFPGTGSLILKAVDGPSQITFFAANGTVLGTQFVQKGQVVRAAMPSAKITATTPIVVLKEGARTTNNDVLGNTAGPRAYSVLPKPSMDLYGVKASSAEVTAVEDGTYVTATDSFGNTQTIALSSGQTGEITIGIPKLPLVPVAGVALPTATAVHLTSNKPITAMVVTTSAEKRSKEMVAFMGGEYAGKKFANVGTAISGSAGYIVCPQADTTIAFSTTYTGALPAVPCGLAPALIPVPFLVTGFTASKPVHYFPLESNGDMFNMFKYAH